MMIVRDVMTRSVVSVERSTPLKDVAQLLVDRRISGLPVTDADGAVIGVISEADLLVKEQGAEAIHHRPFARYFGESARSRSQQRKLTALTAGDAMTAPAVTIPPSQTIHAAAAMMIERKVNRLPVVDDGRLVGIVSRADLVRAYVRSDAELAATIRDEVIRRILWLDPALFSVDVRDGVVTIGGRVGRLSTATMIERAIGMVPGIIDVRSELTWSTDDRLIAPVSYDPVFPFGPR